jgi:hypothetical protein
MTSKLSVNATWSRRWCYVIRRHDRATVPTNPPPPPPASLFRSPRSVFQMQLLLGSFLAGFESQYPAFTAPLLTLHSSLVYKYSSFLLRMKYYVDPKNRGPLMPLLTFSPWIKTIWSYKPNWLCPKLMFVYGFTQCTLSNAPSHLFSMNKNNSEL